VPLHRRRRRGYRVRVTDHGQMLCNVMGDALIRSPSQTPKGAVEGPESQVREDNHRDVHGIHVDTFSLPPPRDALLLGLGRDQGVFAHPTTPNPLSRTSWKYAVAPPARLPPRDGSLGQPSGVWLRHESVCDGGRVRLPFSRVGPG